MSRVPESMEGAPSTGAGTCASSRRRSTPSRSATKSRLLKRKAWEGSKTGGTRIPAGESAGNSIELKRFVSPEPATAGVAEKWAIRWPKGVERTASSPRTAPTVGAESDQLVNICSLLYVVIGGGLALNDTGFKLVQATCPTSSVGRSVTLFPSPGARSL